MKLFQVPVMMLLILFLLSGCRQSQEVETVPTAATDSSLPHNPPPARTPTPARPFAADVVTATPPSLPPTSSPPPAQPTSDLPALTQQMTAFSVPNQFGFPLQRIAGAELGFRSWHYCDGPFRWLDSGHLLLYPIIGHTTWFEERLAGEVTLPVAWDLSGEHEPWLTAVTTDRCKLPVYSAALDRLIDVRDGRVQLYALDGTPTASYPGGMPLALAPSGLRLLAGYTWIDLENGDTQSLQPASSERFFWRPRWSADERLLVQCCLALADVASGEVWWPNKIGDIFFGGIGMGPGARPGGGEHLFTNDAGEITGLMVEASVFFTAGGVYNPIPLIDPVARTYIDLRPQLGLTDEEQYCALDIAPDNGHMWVQCQYFTDWEKADSLLVDLRVDPFAATPFPQAEIKNWSPDGRFLIYFHRGEQSFRLFDVENESDLELIANPGDQTRVFKWSPDGSLLTYWLPASDRLQFYSLTSGESWTVWLPADIVDWQFAPDGSLVAVHGFDGRLYTVTPDPDPIIQPLTSPIVDAQTLRWSPDGRRIAFTGEDAVYVVSLTPPAEWQTANALGALFRYPPTWELREAAERNALTAIDTARVGSGGYPYGYFVDIRDYPNPDGLSLAARVTADFPTIRDDFEFETAAIGPHTSYWTDDMPSAEGALTVFFEDEGRYLAFALNPFHAERPYPRQAEYEALFREMVESVMLQPRLTGLSNGRSNSPVIGADGQAVAFISAGALTDHGGGEINAYLRDMENGITNLVSLRMDGTRSPFPVYAVALSGDGRLLAYYSLDDQLVPGDTELCGEGENSYNCEDLFIFDFATGVTERIPRGRNQGLGADYTVGISEDGRFIAYGEADYAQNEFQLIVYDRETGIEATPLTTSDGRPPNGTIFAPQFTLDNSILFISNASNLVPGDSNDTADVFVWNADDGAVERVSVTSDGAEATAVSGAQPFHEGVGSAVSISGDGRFVAFSSLAADLTTDPVAECDDYRGFSRPCYNLYLHDRQSGATTLVTHGYDGAPADGDVFSPGLSADGRYLVFTSTATNLTADPFSCASPAAAINCGQIYLYDRELDETMLISRAPDGTPGDAGSWGSGISGDGRFVTFASAATNLLFGDDNGVDDIFRYERETGGLELVSVGPY